MSLFDAFRRSPLPDCAARPYDEVRDELRNLDLLLWHGRSKGSRFIRFGQRVGLGLPGSWCSHVSLVFILEQHGERHVLNWESTTESKTPDFFTRTTRSGSQVSALSSRLQNYGGRVYLRRLEGIDRSASLIAEYHRLRRVTSGIPYERDWLEWAGAGLDFIVNREDRASLFCSELLAWAWTELGVLFPRKPSNEYAPAHLTLARSPELPIRPGILLRPEVELLKPAHRRRDRAA